MKNTLLIYTLFFSHFAFSNIELNSVGVVVNESDGESVIYVTNVSDNEVLVYAKEETEETIKISGESIFYVSPPVSKLKPYEKQLIRIVLKNKNLSSQKLGRILIQEIPYIKDPNANRVSFVKSYNIPALAHPKNLIEDYFPWKKAKLEMKDGNSIITNKSNYLIKLMPTFSCSISGKNKTLSFNSPYILPNTEINLQEKCDSIIVMPVSNEGKILEKYTILNKN